MPDLLLFLSPLQIFFQQVTATSSIHFDLFMHKWLIVFMTHLWQQLSRLALIRKIISHCIWTFILMWSIFDQTGTIRTPSVTPGLSSQGYPQSLWISFQATFRDNWSSFEHRLIMVFRLRAVRFKDRFADGDTNSTCVPSENCNIQISRTLSPGSVTATTPLIVLPIRSWFAFICHSFWESLPLPECI